MKPAKNTAPAILVASLLTKGAYPDGIVLAASPEHFTPDIKASHSVVVGGLPEVLKCNIVIFGITPTRPDRGFGYPEISEETVEVSAKI
ncbi:hypothetical protein N9P08_04120 [Alphaproteobacteria bacterium]|nr:hypothetical protein [Alphaproteobacteria bacterium]